MTEVDPTSTTAERGLKEGDVILEVAGKPVFDLFEVREAISKARTENKSSVIMKIRRSGASRFVAIRIGKV